MTSLRPLLLCSALAVLLAGGACDGGISFDYHDYIVIPEICFDGIDNDKNGDIDCDDVACADDSHCKVTLGHGLEGEGASEGEGAAGEGEGAAGEGEGAAGEGEGAAGEGEGAAGEGEGEGFSGRTEVEPNNTAATANVFADPYLAAIDPAGDVDCVSIDANAGDQVTAFTRDDDGSSCSNDTVLDAFDPSGFLLQHNDDNFGLCSQVKFVAGSSGTYTVCSGALDAGDRYAYRILVNHFVCGDDTIEGNETCDGNDLAGNDCASRGFGTGTLGCAADCGAFDTSFCVAPFCGDGIKNAFESCDGSDFGTATCALFTGGIGSLVCNSNDCTIDSSGCQAPFCGDGIINGSDSCEPGLLGGHTCAEFTGGGGTLSCTAGCAFDSSQCAAPFCGDGVKQANEQCDDGNNSDNDGCSSSCTVEVTCPSGQTLVETDVTTPLNIADVATQASPASVAATGTVQSAVVRIDDLQHTFDADLTLTIIAPSGGTDTLALHEGSGGDNYTDTVFDDTCTSFLSSSSPPFTGCFKPDAALSVLHGVAANGTWQLQVADGSGGDIGVLNAWTLFLCVQ